MNAEIAYGAARERTALAWRRTSLSFVVNGVLLVRSSHAWVQVAALLVLAFGTAFAAGLVPGRQRTAIVTGAAAIVGVLDLVAIVSGP